MSDSWAAKAPATKARFGVRVHLPLVGAGRVVELAQAVERNGLDSFWIVDHPYPVQGYLHFLEQQQADPLVVCSWAASATSRISVGTGALIAPLRRAHLLANGFRSLQTLSEGRCIAGMAAGWNRSEYERTGVDYAQRGQLFDVVLDELRNSEPYVPVLIAGGRVSLGHGNLGIDGWSGSWLRRARRCDGWLVRPQARPDLVAEGLDRIGATDDQRQPFRVTHFNFTTFVTDTERRAELLGETLGKNQIDKHESEYWLGTASQTRDRIMAMLGAGVNEIVAHLLDCNVEAIDAWAELVREVRDECNR